LDPLGDSHVGKTGTLRTKNPQFAESTVQFLFWALVKSGSADVRICGCCIRIRAGISVRVRIRVRDGVRISNRVRRRVKLVNYSLITALPIAASADPLFTRGLPFRTSKHFLWRRIPLRITKYRYI